MKFKKHIALLLCISFVLSVGSVVNAEEVPDEELLTESVENEDEEYIPRECAEEITKEEYTTELEKERTVVNLEDEAEDGIASMASGSTVDIDQWEKLYESAFGAEYFAGFTKKDDGATLTGNTNALEINCTDLYLPGKNGLDVKLTRRYNNQGTDSSYAKQTLDSEEEVDQKRDFYIMEYGEGQTINVTCFAEDDFYEYLKNGCYVTEIPTDERHSVKVDDVTIYYYFVEDICDVMTEPSDNSVHLTYRGKLLDKHININAKQNEPEEIKYRIYEYRTADDRAVINEEWSFIFPMVSSRVVREEDGSGDDWYREDLDNKAVFRNLNNEIFSFNTDTWLKKEERGDNDIYTYGFSGNCSKNNSLYFEAFYNLQTHPEKGFEYNFIIDDTHNGYKYYFKAGNVVDFSCTKIVGVEDEYGHCIVYEWGKVGKVEKLSKIIDTHGNEILFTYTDGLLTVTYDNGDKTLTYATVEDSGELNNGSILEGKPVTRFTFTNEAGESTEYYSRKTELPAIETGGGSDLNENFYFDAFEDAAKVKESNIERVVYPNGRVTDYSYTRVYQKNRSNGVVMGQWAISKIEDYVNGSVATDTYTFSGFEEVSIQHTSPTGLVTKSDYDSNDRLTQRLSSHDGQTQKETYTYTDGELTEKTVYVNGKEDTYTYDYSYSYKYRYDEIKLNGYKAEYSYHRGTDIPSTITYKKGYDTHYAVKTELTEDGRNIASETVKRGTTLYAKTFYTYDADGNVASISRVVGDTNEDGELTMEDKTSTELYNHTYENGTHTVVISMENIEDCYGDTTESIAKRYVYDMYGNPVSHTDGNGNITTITYDNASRPVKYEFPEYLERTVQYNIPQREVITTDERGARYKYIYDELGDVLKVQRYNGGWQTLEANSYDVAGRLVRKNTYRGQGEGTKEVYSYDVFNRPVEKKVYELPDELLYTEAYLYTESSSGYKVTTEKTGSDGSVIAKVKQNYDSRGNLIKTEYITDEKTLSTSKTYDILNRVLTEKDANGNKVTYTYDIPGNITKITYPDGTTTQTGYDMLGRTVSTTDAMGNTAHFQYDSLDRLIRKVTPFDGEITGETLYEYDANGNLQEEYVKVKAGEYRHTTHYYNAVNQLTSTTQHGSDGDIATRYAYDAEGTLVSFETGLASYMDSMEHPTLYNYDKWGNLTSLTDPMGYTESYTYDYMGNMLSKTDKNGNTVSFEYNTFGLVSKTDGETEIVNTYNGIGQLVSANTVGQNQTSYTYDPFGNVSTVTQGASLQSYAYDNNGNITAYTLSIDGEQKASETYTYNDMNRLTAQNVNGKNYSFTYNANGNMTGRAVDGVTSETYTYNNAGLLIDVLNGNAWYSVSYRLDGLKTGETNYFEYYSKRFSYDDFGRLTGDFYSGIEDTFYTNTYTYDSRGNRLTMSDGTVTTNYTYDLNNRLVSKNKITEGVETERISLFYDKNGNTVSQRTLTLGTTEEMSVGVLGEGIDTGIKLFEYDGFNRLTKYTDDDSVASYTYYADNLRAGKTVNGASKQFYWNGENLAGETNGTAVKTYSYDLLGVSAVNDGTTQTYFAKDTHSDIVAHLNASGEITTSQYFDSFGNKNNPITEDEFGYTGEYQDLCSGLIYLRNRYYDPSIGRFITEDPARDGLNWYVYVNSNPVMFVDPSGLVVTTWDRENLSKKDLEQIIENDTLWRNGNKEQKRVVAESSRNIREKYLKSGQKLLDNGYVIESNQQNISRSMLYGEVVVNTCMGYQRLYKEDYIYIKICDVNIEVQTVTPRVSVSEICAYIGQVSKGYQPQAYTGKTSIRTYTHSCDWGWVIDYGTESMTTAGAVIDIAIQRGTAKHTMTINNQLYSTSYLINGKMQRENFSSFDVLSDVLQRPERR